MRLLIIFALVLSITTAQSGILGYISAEPRNWKFIQAVGGMKVSEEEGKLVIECDVSGVKKVTVKPTMVNSGIGVRKIKHKRVGSKIRLTLVTSVIEKGISSRAGRVDVSKYPAGIYEVEYLDPDGTTHPLGKVTLPEKKKEER